MERRQLWSLPVEAWLSHWHPQKSESVVEPPGGGVALALAPPKVRIRMRSEANRYAARAKTVAIRHVSNHEVVAMVEIISPGNKNNQNGLNAFVSKARQALAAGIDLLIGDL